MEHCWNGNWQGKFEVLIQNCAIRTGITTGQERSKLAQVVTGGVRFECWQYSCLSWARIIVVILIRAREMMRYVPHQLRPRPDAAHYSYHAGAAAHGSTLPVMELCRRVAMVPPKTPRRARVSHRIDICRGKVISITHSECVFVALVIQHAMRMRQCSWQRSKNLLERTLVKHLFFWTVGLAAKCQCIRQVLAHLQAPRDTDSGLCNETSRYWSTSVHTAGDKDC